MQKLRNRSNGMSEIRRSRSVSSFDVEAHVEGVQANCREKTGAGRKVKLANWRVGGEKKCRDTA